MVELQVLDPISDNTQQTTTRPKRKRVAKVAIATHSRPRTRTRKCGIVPKREPTTSFATVKRARFVRGQSSMQVFEQIIGVKPTLNSTAKLLSKECFQAWLFSRRSVPKYPEESFRRALTAHVIGADGRRPFPPQAEGLILQHLRVSKVWPCFQDLGDSCKIGEHGFKATGFHERKSKKHLSAKPKSAVERNNSKKPRFARKTIPTKISRDKCAKVEKTSTCLPTVKHEPDTNQWSEPNTTLNLPISPLIVPMYAADVSMPLCYTEDEDEFDQAFGGSTSPYFGLEEVTSPSECSSAPSSPIGNYALPWEFSASAMEQVGRDFQLDSSGEFQSCVFPSTSPGYVTYLCSTQHNQECAQEPSWEQQQQQRNIDTVSMWRNSPQMFKKMLFVFGVNADEYRNPTQSQERTMVQTHKRVLQTLICRISPRRFDSWVNSVSGTELYNSLFGKQPECLRVRKPSAEWIHPRFLNVTKQDIVAMTPTKTTNIIGTCTLCVHSLRILTSNKNFNKIYGSSIVGKHIAQVVYPDPSYLWQIIAKVIEASAASQDFLAPAGCHIVVRRSDGSRRTWRCVFIAGTRHTIRCVVMDVAGDDSTPSRT